MGAGFHGGFGATKGAGNYKSARVSLPRNKDQLNHIFGNRTGHLPDTPGLLTTKVLMWERISTVIPGTPRYRKMERNYGCVTEAVPLTMVGEMISQGPGILIPA